MSFTNVFGGSTIYPSDVSYLSIALSADTPLQWPLESSGAEDPAARIIDVTPDASGHSVVMPDATLTGAGQTILFNNLSGSYSFYVEDFDGNTLATVGFGEQWQLYLAVTTTAAGTWRVFRFGASTATVQPSALAGFGLTVTGSTLSQSAPVTTFSTTGLTLATSSRAGAFVWNGSGAGTLNLLTAASAGNNYFVLARNAGGGDLTIDPSGTELINGASTLALRPGDSATLITDGATWYTVGLGQEAIFAFDYTSISVTGGNYTLAGSELNRIAYKFVGALTSDVYIIIPATVQQYWITNATTGSFNFYVKISGGAATQVAQNAKGIYYCNGSIVVLASDPTSLSLPVTVAQGGTGSITASGARLNLGISTFADPIVTATTGASVRTTISAAASGANGDITSLTGLTTPLSVAQGGTAATTAGAARTSLGGTTVGGNMFTLANPSAITFPRFNADNTVSALDAATFRTAIGVGTGSGTVTSVGFTGGLISVATATTTPALTVAGTSGGIPYFSSATTWATSAALAASALVIGGGAGVAPSTTTTGTGVVTALGVAVGSAGAFVTFNGALGTPSSGTVTNLTGTASININGTVGATTANTGAFTTLSASSTVSGTGFSTYLASPPAIGGTAAAAITGTTITANTAFAGPHNGTVGATTPSTGAFTTLAASSTVSGTGFSTYLASPPAIGGTAAAAITGTTITANTAFAGPHNGTVGATTPNTGAFTTLTASSTVTLSPASANVVLSPTGTGVVTINPATAGTINNCSIGGTTAAAGTFTTVTGNTSVTSPLVVGGSAVSSTLTVQSTSGAGTTDAIIFKTGSQVEQFRILTGGGITSASLVDAVGYKGMPQNSQTASYTLALTDMGKMVNTTTGGVVIPANASVAFPVGSTVIVYNNSASNQTISITTDTIYLAGTATTGSRTLAQRGLATLVKVASTTWVASGAGVT